MQNTHSVWTLPVEGDELRELTGILAKEIFRKTIYLQTLGLLAVVILTLLGRVYGHEM